MIKIALSIILGLFPFLAHAQSVIDTTSCSYLSDVRKELSKTRPDNVTINLVFHGHSVPSGYWANYEVHTLESYPHLVLVKIKEMYPYAVVNVITTSIGGEYAEKGQKRFATDVLPHKPDVLFIDYALNDIGIGLERTKVAWEKMIEEALKEGIKVVLITPSPDQRYDIAAPGNKLELHADQIRALSKQYNIGLADPFMEFQKIAREQGSIEEYMASVNHPNRKGHDVIAAEIIKCFENKNK